MREIFFEPFIYKGSMPQTARHGSSDNRIQDVHSVPMLMGSQKLGHRQFV